MLAADANWCLTTATDAKAFYYNAEYINQLTTGECEFTLSHEALHCALLHFSRRGHRSKFRWDVACDYAVNGILIADGMIPPPDALYLKAFDNMTAEEIYHCIDENPEQETLDKHLFDPQNSKQEGGQKKESNLGTGKSQTKATRQQKTSKGASKPTEGVGQDSSDNHNEEQHQGGGAEQGQSATSPMPDSLSEHEITTLSTKWQQRMVSAAQTAKQAGKLGGNMARMVNIMIRPTLPWRQLLDRFVSQVARDDYNYNRPSSRRGDPAIFPGLRSNQLNIALALDVSGSITDDEIGQFVSEINAIKSRFRCEVSLFACDRDLSEGCPWHFNPWEEMRFSETIKGGGGTDFCPVFKFLDQQDIAPDVVVYFTDAEGHFPIREPAYPVIWLVKGHGDIPWGQRVQLN